MTTAVYFGTFDPIHLAHESIIRRAAQVFDRVYVVIDEAPVSRTTMLSVENRVACAHKALEDVQNVFVASHSGPDLEFCKSAGATHIVISTNDNVRVNAPTPAQVERMRREHEIEFVQFMSANRDISSTNVRERFRDGRPLENYVSRRVIEHLWVSELFAPTYENATTHRSDPPVHQRIDPGDH